MTLWSSLVHLKITVCVWWSWFLLLWFVIYIQTAVKCHRGNHCFSTPAARNSVRAAYHNTNRHAHSKGHENTKQTNSKLQTAHKPLQEEVDSVTRSHILFHYFSPSCCCNMCVRAEFLRPCSRKVTAVRAMQKHLVCVLVLVSVVFECVCVVCEGNT